MKLFELLLRTTTSKLIGMNFEINEKFNRNDKICLVDHYLRCGHRLLKHHEMIQ